LLAQVLGKAGDVTKVAFEFGHGDERASSPPDAAEDVPGALQRGESLPEGVPADPELVSEVTLARQTRAFAKAAQ
jgi:hypothetical protein